VSTLCEGTLCGRADPCRLTCDELLAIARKGRPNVRYTRNANGTAIAAWHNGRWCQVAGLLIDGTWASIGDLFINGEPVTKGWIE
jgi:hypothetical protein